MLCYDNTISSSKINWNLIALNKGLPTQLISLNSKATCFFSKTEKNHCNMHRDKCFLKLYELSLRLLYIVCMDINFLLNFFKFSFFLDQWDWCCILFVSVIFCNRLWSNNRRFLYQTVRHRWSCCKTRQ